MKSKNRLWTYLSIGLMVSVASAVSGGYTPAKPPLDETITTTNLIADSPVQVGHGPGALTWQLTVKVSPSNKNPGYVIATGEGEGKRDTNGELKETYAEGTIVKLEARANVGWKFDEWAGQIPNAYGVLDSPYSESTERPIYILMYQNIEIIACFQELKELVVDSTEGGNVSPEEGSHYYERGDLVTLTAEPEPGFMFLMWEGDTDSAQFSGDQITFTMDLDRSITAIFIEIPQMDDIPMITFPWAPLPESQSEPPFVLDPEGIGPFLPPLPEGEPLPEGFLPPTIDFGPPGESFDEDIKGQIRPNFPWEPPSETDPEPGLEQPRQTGEGEKPAGKLADPGVRKLEVIVTRGDMGAVEVAYSALKGTTVRFRDVEIDLGVLPIKPTSGPEGSWQNSMAFSWLIRPHQPIQLTAKPFEGYRFVRWNTDKFTKIEETTSTKPFFWGSFGPMYNPENPVLTINKLRGDLTLHAYFAPILPKTAPPEDALPQEDLDVEDEDTEDDSRPIPIEVIVSTTSDTIEDEAGCESVVTIEYEARDTSTSHPIAYVQLDVDGSELSSWSGTPSPMTHYKKETSFDSGCRETHVTQLKAVNEDGQTKTTTKDAKIPPLSTHFEWGVLDAPTEGDCKMQLIINYQAVDSGTPENPITNVVVKANGVTWQNSGNISSLWYEKSFVKLVDCGQLYRIEVIGTDADGNKYTYRETITIPEAESDEPPPPPPPPPPQTTLYAAYIASAQCSGSGLECSCQLTISFDGKDLTLGDYPVKRVILKVNGTNWRDSGDITKTHHHDSVTKTVDCGQTFNIELIVRNSIGQEVKSTGSITTPGP